MVKRIVYLNPIGGLGGAERLLLDLLATVRVLAPEYELHLILAGAGPLAGEAEKLGVRTRVLALPEALAQAGDFALANQSQLKAAFELARQGLRALASLREYTRQLAAALEDLQPALVHSNGIKTHLLGRRALGPDVPIVWHLHDFLSARKVSARTLRWSTRGVAAGIAVSQAAAADARKVLPSVPVEVVYNGIDLERFSPGPGLGARLDELAGLPPAPHGTLRAGLVATYARWKGHDVFLNAAARFSKLRPEIPIRWYLIGGPIYQTPGSQFSESELRAQVRALGLEQCAGFIGFQSDPAWVYRSLDLVVHASVRPETFGLTIVEAMACARPVLVAAAGGARELFTDGHDAAGFPPGDVAALTELLMHLAGDPRRRAQLGAQAHLTAQRRFSRVRLGQEILGIYRRILQT